MRSMHVYVCGGSVCMCVGVLYVCVCICCGIIHMIIRVSLLMRSTHHYTPLWPHTVDSPHSCLWVEAAAEPLNHVLIYAYIHITFTSKCARDIHSYTHTYTCVFHIHSIQRIRSFTVVAKSFTYALIICMDCICEALWVFSSSKNP